MKEYQAMDVAAMAERKATSRTIEKATSITWDEFVAVISNLRLGFPPPLYVICFVCYKFLL